MKMQALRLFLWLFIITGVVYPSLITFIAHTTMKHKATGSLVKGGSLLIGQKFEGEKYFWSRPSAVDYNPLPSGGSNLGPTSKTLKNNVEKRRLLIAKASDNGEPPSELLFASGSGLDPHISPAAAYFQLHRIARARKIDEEKIREIVHLLIEKRRFGFIGVPCVNVLKLNLALDLLTGELNHGR